MRVNLCALLAMLLCTSAASPALNAANLTPLGDLPGGEFWSEAYAVSGDGSTVVGRSVMGADAGGGMVGLGVTPGSDSIAYGVSGDGSVVVGETPEYRRAFRWTAEGGMVLLNHNSIARGVSGDGSTIVGWGNSLSWPNQAIRWTSAGEVVGLGNLPGAQTASEAFGVSGDGSVVVGYGSRSISREAFRWTSAGGMVGLDDLPSGLFESQAYGVSADGSTVVGWGNSASGYEAFRWTSGGGMVGLGGFSGGNFSSSAHAVSGDGSVVVGRSYYDAFRWTAAGGMERLWDVLLANGVDPAADGWGLLIDARGVSLDGNVVVGYGVRNGNYEGFIAVISTVPEPAAGDYNQDGIVDAADYVLWRKNDGTPESYNTWRANFGATLGNGAGGSVQYGVPEASSLVLLILTSTALLRRWPRLDRFRNVISRGLSDGAASAAQAAFEGEKL
jgi:probable HAF family extracellular repeat protein